MSQYADLKAQIAKLQAQADEARRTEIDNVVADIRQKIAEYGLTAQDLGFAVAARRGRPPKKAPLPAKYQDRNRVIPGVGAANHPSGLSARTANVF